MGDWPLFYQEGPNSRHRGGDSHLLHGCDGQRRADPVVRSGNPLTVTCGHAYCFRFRSIQQPAAAAQDHQVVCVYCVWWHQRPDDVCIPVQGLCLCTHPGSALWVRSSPSSKHVHGLAIGSCPARQEGAVWAEKGPLIYPETDRGAPTTLAGAILAYPVHLQCGSFQVTYNHFQRQVGPQCGLQGGQKSELVVLPTILFRWAYVFLLCPFAKIQAIQSNIRHGLYLSARVSPSL